MRSREHGSLLIAAGLLFATSCNTGEEVPAVVGQCRKVCQARDLCIADTDLLDCEKRCDDQQFRSELYFQAKARCVSHGNLACDQWASELDNRGQDLCLGESCQLDTCVQRELAAHPLSDAQKDYCQTLTNKLVPCDRSLDPDTLLERCSQNLLQVSEAYADETRDCVDMSCADGSTIPDCLDRLAERYETDIKIFGDLH
jgi:hypothetical protein